MYIIDKYSFFRLIRHATSLPIFLYGWLALKSDMQIKFIFASKSLVTITATKRFFTSVCEIMPCKITFLSKFLFTFIAREQLCAKTWHDIICEENLIALWLLRIYYTVSDIVKMKTHRLTYKIEKNLIVEWNMCSSRHIKLIRWKIH